MPDKQVNRKQVIEIIASYERRLKAVPGDKDAARKLNNYKYLLNRLGNKDSMSFPESTFRSIVDKK